MAIVPFGAGAIVPAAAPFQQFPNINVYKYENSQRLNFTNQLRVRENTGVKIFVRGSLLSSSAFLATSEK